MDCFHYPLDTETLLRKKRRLRRELLAQNPHPLRKKIAILGGSTTNEVADQLGLFLLQYGIEAEFYQSEYAQYWKDAMFGTPELDEFHPDIIYIHTSWRNLTALPTPGIFGETSAEVCGIYAVNPGASEVGVTTEPTIRINGNTITATSVSDNAAVYDSGGLLEGDIISVTAASGANLWINNANSSSYTVTADDQMVRVIVQSGEREPYIVVIK